MPWIAVGKIAASALGAGAGLYGAKKSADAAQDIADSQNPYDIARANFQTNNPNITAIKTAPPISYVLSMRW